MLAAASAGILARHGSPPGVEEALRSDPASPHRWCDLGDALFQAGQVEKADYCFRRGVALGPNIAPVLARAANFYIQREQPGAAFPHLSRLLRIAPQYDDIILSYYDRLASSPAAALASIGGNARAVRSYFRRAAAAGNMDRATAAWTRLNALGAADARIAAGYLDLLIRRQQYRPALEAWTAWLGPRAGGYPRSSRVFNGSFESEPAGTPFDWRIAPAEGVEAVRERKDGRPALRLSFQGTRNIDYAHAAQWTYLDSGRYRLRALVKTENLATGQGVLLQVVDPGSPGALHAETGPIAGTKDWTQIQCVFDAPGPALALVRICCRPSRELANNVRGTAWVTGVRLEHVQ